MLSTPETMNQGSKYEEEQAEVMGGGKVSKNKMILILAVVGVITVLVVWGLYAKYSNNDKPAESEQTQETQNTQPIDNLYVFQYTPEEVEALRENGYTGDEITSFQSQQVSSDLLVEEAKAKRETLLRQTYVELSKEVNDSASPAYKKLLNDTWLGGTPTQVIAKDAYSYSTTAVKENADYVKLEPRGKQLFIKITLNSGENIFYSVHPSRWVQMRDRGNIVITYDLVHFGNTDFVENVEEIIP